MSQLTGIQWDQLLSDSSSFPKLPIKSSKCTMENEKQTNKLDLPEPILPVKEWARRREGRYKLTLLYHWTHLLQEGKSALILQSMVDFIQNPFDLCQPLCL